MDTIKSLLNTFARPLLSKYIIRLVGYGLTAVSAKLAIDAPDSDAQAKLAGWITAGIIAGLTMLIDYFQHRTDKAEVPPVK